MSCKPGAEIVRPSNSDLNLKSDELDWYDPRIEKGPKLILPPPSVAFLMRSEFDLLQVAEIFRSRITMNAVGTIVINVPSAVFGFPEEIPPTLSGP